MPKFSKKLVIGIVLILGFSVSLFVIKEYKYYVKRFIKRHDFLYVPLKIVVDLKYEITNAFSNKVGSASSESFSFKTTGPWMLHFDFSQPGKQYKKFWGNIGYESFKNGILSRNNRTLFKLMNEANTRHDGTFRYIRAHNLFSNGKPPWGEGCDIYHEDNAGNPIYNWTIMDKVFDEIIKYGFKAIVEFGFMPDALASIPGRRQEWGKANISPPRDYEKWRELVKATVEHLLNRYGADEIGSWYFEVWNEPDLGWLFWIEDPKNKPYGNLQEYFKLYDYAVAGAKAAFPGIKIGGPVSAGGEIDKFLEHTSLEKNYTNGQKGTPVDFVSSHNYGKIYPGTGKKKSINNIVNGLHWKINRALTFDHEAVRTKMSELPFLLTETGPKTKGDNLHNSRYMAVWWAKMVDAVFYMKQKWGDSYQPREIVYWSAHQVAKYFKAEMGIASSLKTTNSNVVLKRPLFNMFEALGQLSDEFVPLKNGAKFGDNVHAFATRDKNRSIEILLYHLDEKDYHCVKQDSQEVRLVIDNLPFTDFALSWYSIDKRNSNSYTLWKEMGKPKYISKEQVKIFDKNDDLKLIEAVSRISAIKNKFEKSFKILSNSVALFVLTKI